MGNCWGYQSNPAYYPYDFLAAVNYFRAHHLATPHLTLDMELCNKALAEANLSAYNDGLEPREYPAYKKLTGELKWVEHKGDDKHNQRIACPFAPPMYWYQEIVKFNFEASGQQIDADGNLIAPNFQTLIWRTTRKIGVGVALTKDKKKVYVVARFDGDYELSPESNVKKPFNGLPALRIQLDMPPVTDKKQSRYRIKLQKYETWCKSQLFLDDSEFNIETYIQNNPWVRKQVTSGTPGVVGTCFAASLAASTSTSTAAQSPPVKPTSSTPAVPTPSPAPTGKFNI